MMCYCLNALRMIYACAVLGVGWGFRPGLMRTRIHLGGGSTIATGSTPHASEGTEAFGENDDLLYFNSFLPQDHPVGILYKRKQQLWIDLRDTSLFPHEANTFLMDQLFGVPAINGDLPVANTMKDSFTPPPPLFDGALVSEAMLETMIRKRPSGSNDGTTSLYPSRN
jgi:hypothetical protein